MAAPCSFITSIDSQVELCVELYYQSAAFVTLFNCARVQLYLTVWPLCGFYTGQSSTVFPEHENWENSDPIMTRYSLHFCGIVAETVTTIRISIVIPEAGEELVAENPFAVCFSAESVMRYDNIASAFHLTNSLIVGLVVVS